MRSTKETIENYIGVSALFFFALFYLVPSWRGAMRDILAGLGFIFFAFAIPYLVSQPARTRRQRASLMFFGLGGIMFFIMAVGALLPSRFADHSPGIWILEAFILPTGIAAFTVPFLFLHFANRVDRHRYGHIRRALSIAGAPRLGAGAWPQAARRDLQPTLRAGSVSFADDLSHPMRIGPRPPIEPLKCSTGRGRCTES